MTATPLKAVAGFVVALALLAACGDDGGGDDDTDDPDTTEEASGPGGDGGGSDDATNTTLSEDEEVLAAYDAAVEALIAAYDPPDPEHKDLLATHDGETLSRLRVVLGDLQVAGNSEVWLSSEYEATVQSLVGDTAVVHDCYKETTQLVDTDSRDPAGEPGEASALREVQMERIDGTWKVVHGETLEESCEPSS